MIEAAEISKSFDKIKAIDHVSAKIQDGAVFGLIGTNGAGKSTFLRMLCGVLKPDKGEIFIEGIPVYENEEAKKQMFYISDEQYFFPNSTPAEMMKYYVSVYENFDRSRFLSLLSKFGLDKDRKINTFSKGMKKQVSVLLGICSGT
ncbi:MAG TPA: ABC transporter ATP-binding protein, partial [Lachnospiraceae bacterium]|nr:ABC transporter ATP-binding protein [Lachnospiraceae bacterium]